MPLTTGQRLGPYEIVAPLGAGGMGEVYRARDTRLERTVAIKVLPPSLASDPEFKARFDREAKSISALNHPHICTLYDVGEGTVPVQRDGSGARLEDPSPTSYLVMEHLDGETLADRLKKGPLPVEQAIDLASQIADALDKAHRQGIVHRDLKPANVFLVRAAGASGAVHGKLLDFGLAKLAGPVHQGTLETKLMTTPPKTSALGTAQGAPLTSQGTILGTFQYMAPEQIEGHEADARTDIWAFGCLLYEMLTGKRAFDGKSQASLIASILERQPPPMAELQPMTPPALGRLVRTCLEKNPDNRFHTAHDLWLHLQWIEEGGSAAGLPAPVVLGRKRRNRAMFAGATLAIAAIAAAGAWWMKPAPPPAASVSARFSYPLPEGIAFSRTGRKFVTVSPDGTMIAYIANSQIYLRKLHELEALPIRGTDLDPLDLVFSPDSREIAFFAAGNAGNLSEATLKKIDVTGGKAIQLCSAGPPFGASWRGDRIVFSLGDRILSVAATGGAPDKLLKATNASERLARPQLIDDGRMLLFSAAMGNFSSAQIVVAPVGGGDRRVLVEGGMDGRVLPGGYLIWTRDSTLFSQPINLSTLKLAGGPVALLEGIREAVGTGAGQFGISDNGTIVFAPGTSEQTSDLVWVDRTGREEPTGIPPLSYTYPRLSPDGTRIVTNSTEGDGDVWIWNLERKTISKLTSGPDIENYPVWTPDSRFIIYRSGPPGTPPDVYRRAADNTGTVERLTNTPDAEAPQLILADGQRLLVRISSSDTTAQGQLAIFPLQPNAKPETVMPASASTQVSADISPDGRWIAYQSPEGSTRDEIHVRPFPNTDGGHWQISSGGGSRPMWSKGTTTELFYFVNGPPRLMRVQVLPTRAGGPFLSEMPVTILEASKYQTGFTGRAFEISNDNKRFLMVKPVGSDATDRQSLTVITHWMDEVRARVR